MISPNRLSFIPSEFKEFFSSEICDNVAVDSVIDAFWMYFETNHEDMAVAAVHALAHVITKSEAETLLELFVDLRASIDILRDYANRHQVSQYLTKRSHFKRQTTLSLVSACELYQQFAMRHRESKPLITLEELKNVLISQASKFAERILQSKQTIASVGRIMFTRHQMVVLTHGRSSCVEAVLKNAWISYRKRFSVLVTRHENLPEEVANVNALVLELQQNGIASEAVNVAAVGSLLPKVDFVLVGAEAVVENGGIINRIGTATVAMVADKLRVPFYVACEACKFTRTFPLQQQNISNFSMQTQNAKICSLINYQQYLDYTSPLFITLLFTDLGVFSTSGVSDELNKLFGGF